MSLCKKKTNDSNFFEHVSIWKYVRVVSFIFRNVRCMNQGKLEVVKQEMVRVNINILVISELKWTGMGKFNSDDHYIYYCGQDPFEEMEQPSQSTKVQNAVHGCSLKNSRTILVSFQGKPFNITVIQVYAPTTNAKEVEVE